MDLNKLHTAIEASLMLGKADSYVTQLYRKYPGRLKVGTYRKIGREIIITQDGIDHLRKQTKGDKHHD